MSQSSHGTEPQQAQELVEAEAQARRKLADRMHDKLQQLLSAARMRIGLVRRQLDDPAAIEGLWAAERLLEEAMNESTALIERLRGNAREK